MSFGANWICREVVVVFVMTPAEGLMLAPEKSTGLDSPSFGPRLRTITQAMSIGDGNFLATGSGAQIRALAGPQTKSLDLKGRTVMPGLISTYETYEHPLDSWIWFDPQSFRHALPNDDLVIIRWMDYMPPKEQLERLMMRELVAKAKPGQGIMIYFSAGRHFLKFGGSFQRYQFKYRSDSRAGGVFAFSSSADFLRNNVSTSPYAAPWSDKIRGMRQRLTGLYIQDDLNVRPGFRPQQQAKLRPLEPLRGRSSSGCG